MFFTVDFGTATITSVGYTQKKADGTDAVARTTTGVVSLGNGVYGVEVTPDASTVLIKWDTGGASPVYAPECILENKRIIDYLDAALSSRLAAAGYTAPPSASANADAVWAKTLP
jgi:hypothetical protein